jgi:hypothetical protein
VQRFTLPVLLSLSAVTPLAAQDATIRVRPGEVVSHVSRYMTGACLEDVNHEVYGGLYSQMIFGESFQELPAPGVPQGFTAHGGRWTVKDGVIAIDGGPGPLLVADGRKLAAADEVGVEVFLPGKARGVAGLVVHVSNAKTGADTFLGYEVALSSDPQFLRLGRHRYNWEPIKDVPCAVPFDRWVSLGVRLGKNTLEILVDGKSVLSHEDRDHPLAGGGLGLRNFDRTARFRNLWVKRAGKTTPLPFRAAPRWDEGVSGMWRGLRRGKATGRFALETERPFIGRRSQRITFEGGQGEIGIENRGLNRWGLSLVAKKPYEGYVWLRADRPTEVVAALESGDGTRTYATARLTVEPGEWRRLRLALTPDGTDRAARFALKLDRPGTVVVGHAFLQPGPWGRYRGLPVRGDVAEALIEQGLTVLRYGGSMVNAPEYRWKNMLGPRDRRPPYRGFWYPESSNGWGILDFLDFCEAAGFLAVPAFNTGESAQDMADFVEYVNGPADSLWGKKRADTGHPKPYRLRHLEFGNEEAVDESYWQRFRAVAEAVWAKDPDIILIVGDFAYNDRITDPFSFKGAPRIKSLGAHKKILELARSHKRPVWFDVHVSNHEPKEPAQLRGGIHGLRDFGRELKKLCPEADFKVCVFEENATNHKLRRGLAHAHAINELERSGDLVPIVCAANCLQPDRQNDNGWDQGLLFLSPSKVWGQPSYYVTQMVARRHLPHCVRADVDGGGALNVTAKASADGKVLQLQVVNLEGKPLRVKLDLGGFTPRLPTLQVTEIGGKLDDANTPEEPRRVSPRENTVPLGRRSEYTFPAYSFTILRLE